MMYVPGIKDALSHWQVIIASPWTSFDEFECTIRLSMPNKEKPNAVLIRTPSTGRIGSTDRKTTCTASGEAMGTDAVGSPSPHETATLNIVAEVVVLFQSFGSRSQDEVCGRNVICKYWDVTSRGVPDSCERPFKRRRQRLQRAWIAAMLWLTNK